MKNPLNVLRNRLAYYVAAIADSIIGDEEPSLSPNEANGVLGNSRPKPTTAREATPIYDGPVAEKLADSRAAMVPLLSTEQIAGMVEDERASADLYDDLLDALVATPEQVWDMFDVTAEAGGSDV